MAKSSKLTVMISSRCDDPFPVGAGTTLSSIRIQLKDALVAKRAEARARIVTAIAKEAGA